jgi:hypothetical protein
MKTAICDLCGTILQAVGPPVLVVHHDRVPSENEVQDLADLSEFDLLAGKMAHHICEHSDHAREMAAVGYLASKVYAMTWASSGVNNQGEGFDSFDALRKAWRKAFLTELAKDRTQAAAPAASDAGGSSSDPPSGSNVKKSERNASI